MKENRKRFKLWVILATMAMCLQLLPANVFAEEVITYSVTFNSMEGSTVEAYADVNEGDTIEAPTAPTKDGYTFGGWCKEAEMTNAWDFATDTVSADTTLYAKWAAASPSYTMSFNVNSGTEVSAISNIASGSNIEAPTAPTKDGYTFEGWYKESELTNAWDFATDTVSADTTLYAKWTAASASDIKSLSLDNYKVAETTPVDVLITADDTYKGSLSDYASQLSETLASQGITADDVRIKTVNTAINVSNFYDWYVFDHYYSPDSADDGTVPENWNNYSGRHPYYYWQETSTGIPRQYLLAAESQLHDKVWGEYEILLNTCETDSSDLQSILFKNAYEKLGDEAKAAADVLVLQAISKDFGVTFNNDDEFMLYMRLLHID